MGEAMLFAATIRTSKKGKRNATCTGSFSCIDLFRNWIYGSLSMGSCRGVAGSLVRRNGDRTWRVCGETPLLPVVIRSQWEPRVPETTGALRGVSSRLRDGDNQPHAQRRFRAIHWVDVLRDTFDTALIAKRRGDLKLRT